MLRYPPRVVYSVAFFLLLMALVVVSKPPFLYGPDGRPIPFGVGPGRTLWPLGVVTVVGAIMCLYVFALVDMTFARPAAAAAPPAHHHASPMYPHPQPYVIVRPEQSGHHAFT